MLEYAKKHEEKLRQIFFDTAFNSYYMYENFYSYREVLKLSDDTWNENHFVSIYNYEIIGFIAYRIKRDVNSTHGLIISHFGDYKQNKYIFGKDVMTAIKDIFEKYNFNKINFSVAVGNPVEKTYDRLVKHYNGRIVGIKEQEIRLIDGRLYDEKMYEILAVDYYGKKNRD